VISKQWCDYNNCVVVIMHKDDDSKVAELKQKKTKITQKISLRSTLPGPGQSEPLVPIVTFASPLACHSASACQILSKLDHP